jgi:predicted exporter
MTRRARVAFVLSFAVLLAMGVFVQRRFAITTDIRSLLPGDDDQEALSLVQNVAESELGRTMVLTLGAPDTSAVIRATRAFETALRDDAVVSHLLAAIDGGPKDGTEQAIYALYHPRRLAFLAADAAGVQRALTPEALTRAAEALRDELGNAMSPLIGRVAPSDPLQILPRLFRRLEREQGGNLRIEEGRFLTRDGRFGVLFLRSKARGFDSAAQAPLLAGISRVFTALNRAHGGVLTLDQSGVNRFAVKAEGAIKHDMELVSTLSMAGLGLLMFGLFRSVRLLLVAAIPLGAGMLTGISVCLLLYGRVHGITLAFGASLLGVALDYVEHLYCHHAVAPHPEGPAATLRAIGPSLITGAATTLVGFVALGGSGFRGLQEVAVFSSCGLLAALVTTFTMLPALLPRTVRPVALRARIVQGMGALFVALSRHRRLLWVLPGVALVVCALGLPRLSMSKDTTLGQLDAALLVEDERVRNRVARYEQMRFVLVTGKSDEAALEANDAVYAALAAAQDAGEIGGYRNVAAFLPSAAQQQRVAEAARAALGDGDALLLRFAEAGFRPEGFAPFAAALHEASPSPLTFEALAASALSPMVLPFRITLTQGTGFLTFLERIKDPVAFGKRIAALPHAHFLDQQAQLARGHALYQERTLALVLWGVLGVFLLLLLRYRSLRITLAAFLPSALAAALTLATLGLSGRALDLVGLSALLMVISMGVDYGVFLADADHSEEERNIALLSVFLAASTTVLGFGLLALSRHPMLSMIGTTATVGMVSCMLLSPTTLILLGKHGAPTP